MIEKARTGERVYLAVKHFLLAQSDYKPGERVDIGDLSRRFSASASPVRAALHRMVGERLLVSHQGEGFSLPRITEPGLSDLYKWNAALLANALRAPGGASGPAMEPAPPPAPIAALEQLFVGLAVQSGNVEVEWAVAGVNDRLHRARRAELDLLEDFAAEVSDLRRLSGTGDASGLRQAIIAYHRRRLRLAPAVVRHLHGLGDRLPR